MKREDLVFKALSDPTRRDILKQLRAVSWMLALAGKETARR